MRICLNGDWVHLDQPISLRDLLKEKNIPEQAIVAELNGSILTDFTSLLKEGDHLEIIRMVGGG